MIHHTYIQTLCSEIYAHGYFQNMFKSLAEPNRTKSYKLERVLNKNLEGFSDSQCFQNCGMQFKP